MKLSLAAFTVLDSGLTGFNPDADWDSCGRELRLLKDGSAWHIGDWYHHYPRGEKQAACARAGINYASAQVAGSVAAAFPLESRVEGMTFSHHKLVQGRENALDLLRANVGLTVAAFKALLDHDAPAPKEPKASRAEMQQVMAQNEALQVMAADLHRERDDLREEIAYLKAELAAAKALIAKLKGKTARDPDAPVVTRRSAKKPE